MRIYQTKDADRWFEGDTREYVLLVGVSDRTGEVIVGDESEETEARIAKMGEAWIGCVGVRVGLDSQPGVGWVLTIEADEWTAPDGQTVHRLLGTVATPIYDEVVAWVDREVEDIDDHEPWNEIAWADERSIVRECRSLNGYGI